jgi:hypothetical protein
MLLKICFLKMQIHRVRRDFLQENKLYIAGNMDEKQL